MILNSFRNPNRISRVTGSLETIQAIWCVSSMKAPTPFYRQPTKLTFLLVYVCLSTEDPCTVSRHPVPTIQRASSLIPALPLLVTYSCQDCRHVQTCSLESPLPAVTDTWLASGRYVSYWNTFLLKSANIIKSVFYCVNIYYIWWTYCLERLLT